jgi:predicted acyltransferase
VLERETNQLAKWGGVCAVLGGVAEKQMGDESHWELCNGHLWLYQKISVSCMCGVCGELTVAVDRVLIHWVLLQLPCSSQSLFQDVV